MRPLESALSSFIDSDEVICYLVHGTRPTPLPFLKFRWNRDDWTDECPQINAVVYRWIGFAMCDDRSYLMAKAQYIEGKWCVVVFMGVIITTF